MRVGVVVVCAVALGLGGCLTRANQEAELEEAGPKEDAFCRSIGTKPNTPEYANCRLTMRQELLRKHTAERARSRDAVICSSVAGTTVCQ